MADEIRGFAFNLKLHGEDGDPILSKDFSAVADGEGGSGSTVHEFGKDRETKKRFLLAAFREFAPEEILREYGREEGAWTAAEINEDGFAPSDWEDEFPYVPETAETYRMEPTILDDFSIAAEAETGEYAHPEEKGHVSTGTMDTVPSETDGTEGNGEDSEESELGQRIRNALKDIFDDAPGEKSGRTSAFIASRVVLARFDYLFSQMEENGEGYLSLSDEKDREKMVDFVRKGLFRLKHDFSLNTGSLQTSYLSLLPSTFVSIHIAEETEDALTAEVLWSGDSRAYCLNEEGLRLLSKDDEENELITNSFSAEEGKATRLNYLKYTIRKPCLLFVGSDGIFDPQFVSYASVGVKEAVLSSLEREDVTDECPFKNALEDFFRPYQGDDISVALRVFLKDGQDFHSLKELFVKQESENHELFSAVQKNLEPLKIVLSGREEEIRDYILKRIAAPHVYRKIVGKVLSLLETGGEDPLLSRKVLDGLNLPSDPEKRKKALDKIKVEETMNRKKDFFVSCFAESLQSSQPSEADSFFNKERLLLYRELGDPENREALQKLAERVEESEREAESLLPPEEKKGEK